jgi:hypothetical protein
MDDKSPARTAMDLPVPPELQRVRDREAQSLRERLSSIPFYARQAAKWAQDGRDYWQERADRILAVHPNERED